MTDEALTPEQPANEFEKYPELAAFIGDSAWKMSGISMARWGKFIETLNASLIAARAFPGQSVSLTTEQLELRERVADCILDLARRKPINGIITTMTAYNFADAILALLPSAQGKEEDGWVIEHADSSTANPVYWAALTWQADHLKAVRFSRRTDAETTLMVVTASEEVDHQHRVCLHSWSAQGKDGGEKDRSPDFVAGMRHAFTIAAKELRLSASHGGSGSAIERAWAEQFANHSGTDHHTSPSKTERTPGTTAGSTQGNGGAGHVFEPLPGDVIFGRCRLPPDACGLAMDGICVNPNCPIKSGKA